MSKSEPVLIPQWLKNSGSNNGSGTNRSRFFLRSDDQSGSKRSRTRYPVRSGEPGIRRSSTDQTNSPYLRRTSSNKDSTNSKSYGSFSRSNRNHEWDDIDIIWNRDRTLQAERRHHEYSDHLGSLLPGKHNKDILRHSQSMVSKVGGDSSNSSNSNHSNTNRQLISASNVPNSNQATFGQDFPSLIVDQRWGSGLSRASSPSFTGTVTSLSSASSSTVSQDELENQEVVGIGRTDSLPSQVTVAANSAPLAQRVNGLNMAEAVVQGPSHAHTPLQLSIDTQRLQELAIKQSRQLIPIAPSVTRPLSPVEKQKPKLMQQQSQLQPNHYSNQTVRGGPPGVDVGKASTIGKLQVLKSSRVFNDVSSTVNDTPSPQNDVIGPLTETPGASTTSSAQNKNPFRNQKPAPNERKPSMASTTLEKKTSLQTKSRNDFFNLIKKKASSSSQSSMETSNNYSVGEAPAPAEDGARLDSNDDCCSDASDFVKDGKEECADFCVPPPDEEEAAFMRSLGWEEGLGEEESLTEEEINDFFESIKSRPTSQLKGIWFLRLNYGENCGVSSSGPLSNTDASQKLPQQSSASWRFGSSAC